MEIRQHTPMEDLKVGIWYVYVDYTIDENKPFYVGKGNKKRVKQRERANDHWRNIVAKHGYYREIIFCYKG